MFVFLALWVGVLLDSEGEKMERGHTRRPRVQVGVIGSHLCPSDFQNQERVKLSPSHTQ